jgi:transposase
LPGGRDPAQPHAQGLLSTLVARGKEKKVALVACMRKLIVILNIMIARRQTWDPSRFALG